MANSGRGEACVDKDLGKKVHFSCVWSRNGSAHWQNASLKCGAWWSHNKKPALTGTSQLCWDYGRDKETLHVTTREISSVIIWKLTTVYLSLYPHLLALTSAKNSSCNCPIKFGARMTMGPSHYGKMQAGTLWSKQTFLRSSFPHVAIKSLLVSFDNSMSLGRVF